MPMPQAGAMGRCWDRHRRLNSEAEPRGQHPRMKLDITANAAARGRNPFFGRRRRVDELVLWQAFHGQQRHRGRTRAELAMAESARAKPSGADLTRDGRIPWRLDAQAPSPAPSETILHKEKTPELPSWEPSPAAPSQRQARQLWAQPRRGPACVSQACRSHPSGG